MIIYNVQGRSADSSSPLFLRTASRGRSHFILINFIKIFLLCFLEWNIMGFVCIERCKYVSDYKYGWQRKACPF